MADRSDKPNGGVSNGKKGGYTGGRPADTVNPPVKVPSGAIRPQGNGTENGRPATR